MINRTLVTRRLVHVLLIPAVGLLTTPTRAESPSLVGSMPPEAIAYVELSGLEPVIDWFHDSEYLKLVRTSQPYQNFEKSPQFRKAQAAQQVLETFLGMDLSTLGRKLLGDRMALARLREQIEPVLVLSEEHIETSETREGVQVIEVGDHAFFALDEKWTATANS